ncbi:hypothetical protein [Lentilitoribacter sp. Alg239-R112]|uniref:hypothetical protein n=1 Tax=Lentilitoribacter sp. Alg239-R112 TaxID=2305987 RepID=UPI0015766EF2|nr:hypothetical protein [Lentilitoribacter sp. Alg239-R112]
MNMYKIIIPAGIALSTALLTSTAIANNETIGTSVEEVIMNDKIDPAAPQGTTVLAQLQSETEIEDDCEDGDDDENEEDDDDEDEDENENEDEDEDETEEACTDASMTKQG